MSRDDWGVIIAAAVFTAALILCGVAFAAEPKLPAGVSCEAIRGHVADHGKLKAIRWAREQGYSWAQIAEARKCLR